MTLLSLWLMFGSIAGILLAIEVGYQVGRRRWARAPANARSVTTTLEASVFGLMGLLIAFTFYGAGSRFDNRRNLIVQEAVAISTAYLRLDLLPPEAQPQLREDFRTYLRSRLEVYRQIPDVKAVKAALAASSALQRQIWKRAIEGTKTIQPAAQSLLLSSLNQMIDITTVRTVALMTHPPPAVFVMLVFAVVVSSALAGYAMSAAEVRNWVPIAAFVLVLAASMYVIVDYEYPRVGLIRIDPVDQVLVETLEEMK